MIASRDRGGVAEMFRGVPLGGSLGRIARQRHAVIGGTLVGLVVAVAVFGPLFAPHSPTAFVGPPFQAPNSSAVLGTNDVGQDVLSRLLYGGWTVVWMAFSASLIGITVGTLAGLAAGSGGRWVDIGVMGASDVILGLPQIVLALLFVSMLGPQLWLIVLLVAAAHAPRVARLVRSLTQELLQSDFVQAAEALGLRRWRILVEDVLPNIGGPLLIESGVRLTWSVAMVAALSFLGFGVQVPQADWGLEISMNRPGVSVQPWGVVAPTVAIALFALGANLLADGLSRALVTVERPVSSR